MSKEVRKERWNISRPGQVGVYFLNYNFIVEGVTISDTLQFSENDFPGT